MDADEGRGTGWAASVRMTKSGKLHANAASRYAANMVELNQPVGTVIQALVDSEKLVQTGLAGQRIFSGSSSAAQRLFPAEAQSQPQRPPPMPIRKLSQDWKQESYVLSRCLRECGRWQGCYAWA